MRIILCILLALAVSSCAEEFAPFDNFGQQMAQMPQPQWQAPSPMNMPQPYVPMMNQYAFPQQMPQPYYPVQQQYVPQQPYAFAEQAAQVYPPVPAQSVPTPVQNPSSFVERSNTVTNTDDNINEFSQFSEEQVPAAPAPAAAAAAPAAAAPAGGAAASPAAPAPAASAGAAAPAAGGAAPAPAAATIAPQPLVRIVQNEDPTDVKLKNALGAVKEEIVSKGNEVMNERNWMKQVTEMIDMYSNKVGNVQNNVSKLKKDMKEMLIKKRQIENAILQRQLSNKLKDAEGDMGNLSAAIKHVKNKADEFSRSREELEKTINNINSQLSKLRGQDSADKTASAARDAQKQALISELEAKKEEAEKMENQNLINSVLQNDQSHELRSILQP